MCVRPSNSSGRKPELRISTTRVLFVFLDGVGIGPDDPEVNPFLVARLPTLARLCGGRVPTLTDLGADPVAGSTPTGRAARLDAALDTPGTPQSGTGQAALLTGADTARIHGGHFGPWTPVRLRPLVEERSVLRRAVDGGLRAAFANAYPKGWPGLGGSRRVAAPPLAARGAGLLVRHEEELGAGRAVSSEIVNDGWRRHLGHDWLPDITPEEAGANLAGIASEHDVTLYAHYATDTAGHRRAMEPAVAALERVDAFLSGVVRELPPDVLLFVASDHGNVEDLRTGHTSHPALGIAWGPDAPTLPDDIRGVADFILRLAGATD